MHPPAPRRSPVSATSRLWDVLSAHFTTTLLSLRSLNRSADGLGNLQPAPQRRACGLLRGFLARAPRIGAGSARDQFCNPFRLILIEPTRDLCRNVGTKVFDFVKISDSLPAQLRAQLNVRFRQPL